jgi:Asp-tRNA(Asn)/Glu-tRNA(Gln) amidotransferase A subunit family amidase
LRLDPAFGEDVQMQKLTSFLAESAAFKAGTSTPSKYLARCLAEFDRLEPALKAFVTRADAAGMKAAATASDARWKAGKPLSPVDGMPIGIKDIIETADMPTGQGSPYWAGTETRRDAASVQALREAGAIIVGKTTTTEYATSQPFHETTNPHDPARTPGGSSSGSAAAVGAGIIPAALGTQVVASTLRPASFCGAVGFKPSVGALNRSGSFDHLSQSCTGLLAATPGDAWIVASAISEQVGGDPGFPGLAGPTLPPAPRKPVRLALIETGGWARTTPGARAALATARARLEALGIAVADRRSDPDIERMEQALADAFDLTFAIYDWEYRWPLRSFARGEPAMLGDQLRQRQEQCGAMTIDDYRTNIRRRARIRQEAADLLARYDAFLSLAATGAAPKGLSATGDPAVTVAGSLLGGPCISLPLLTAEGLPLGLQLLGRMDGDADLIGVAGWVFDNAK